MEVKAAKWHVLDKAVRIWQWICKTMPTILDADSKREWRKVHFSGLSSCHCDFARCPLRFLSCLLPLTAELWQAPPCKIYFSFLCIQSAVIFTEVGFSWWPSASQFHEMTGLHSSNISLLVQIWAPSTGSWDLKKQGTLLLKLLWHFIKAIICPLPCKDSFPQTIYVTSICTLIGNCLW